MLELCMVLKKLLPFFPCDSIICLKYPPPKKNIFKIKNHIILIYNILQRFSDTL